MKSGLHFLIAARQCEIDELDQLARTSELVGLIGRLVHALQRERGMSNVFLASRGSRFADQRDPQIAECQALEQAVRNGFDQLETEARQRASAGNSARLFSRIAWVLPGLDALPALRGRIGALELAPAQSTAAFAKLVAGLLAVVFEAADGATDPEISRRWSRCSTSCRARSSRARNAPSAPPRWRWAAATSAQRVQWLHLIESQERCFHVFTDFSSPRCWRLARERAGATMAELERLRRVGTTRWPAAPDAPAS
jgi:hypothetical protein